MQYVHYLHRMSDGMKESVKQCNTYTIYSGWATEI